MVENIQTDVQTMEPVLQPVEQVSQPADIVKPAEPTPEEILNQKIAEAVAKAMAADAEKHRREIQSNKDKAVAEITAAQRRARLAESTMSATRTHLQTLDPDVAKEMELAEYRAREQGRQTMEQEDQATQYQAAVVQKFHEQMTQFITSLGVNPTDPQVDWASDAPDLLTMQQRILDSVSKIQGDRNKALEARLDARIKEAEKRIKKELNVEDVNSVSTAISGGVVAGSDADFVKKFAAGEIPLTKANVERYNKTLNT